MTDPEYRKRIRTVLQRTLEAAEQLQGGVCPDGGGPHCICKCLGLMGQCSAMTAARIFLAYSEHADQRRKVFDSMRVSFQIRDPEEDRAAALRGEIARMSRKAGL